MKLLFISSFFLHAKTQVGGSRRLFHLVEALAEKAEVDLFCLDACREAPNPATEKMAAQGGAGEVSQKASQGVMVPSEAVKVASQALLAPVGLHDFDWAPLRDADAGLTRLWNPPNRVRHGLQKYRPRFERFLERRYDTVVVAFPWALDAFDAFWVSGRERASTLPLFYLEDDLVLEWYAKVSGKISPLRRLWKHYQVFRMAADYRRKLAVAKGFIAISKEEAEVARLYLPDLKSFVLPHALPMQTVPFLDKSPIPKAIGFLANFDHSPNRVALDFLIRDLLPVLRKADASISLVLAGKGLPSQVLAAAGISVASENNGHKDVASESEKTGCKCLGAVADVADFYREIGVLINPVTTGRGLRTKVIEAVAYGCPIVSTKLGREGIDDLDITEAGTAEEFVSESLRLLNANDYELRRRRNRERAEQFYGVDTVAEGLLGWMHGRLQRIRGGKEGRE